MVAVTNHDEVLLPDSSTGLFTGSDHQADVSFFWVNAAPGKGPEFHWHPYAETVHRFRNLGQTNLRMICIHPSPTIIEEFI